VIDHPDYAPVAADLRGRLERWMRETSDPLLDGPVPAPAGALLNAQDQLSAQEPTHRQPNADAHAGAIVGEG
jgi:N-sulfoglucosamine sulfohydrolase